MNDLMTNGRNVFSEIINAVVSTKPENLSKMRLDITLEGDSIIHHAITIHKNGNMNHHISFK